MKKKILLGLGTLALFALLSANLKQARASMSIDPTELCHTWCYAAPYYTCVLHAGDAGGTYIITCYHMYSYV